MAAPKINPPTVSSGKVTIDPDQKVFACEERSPTSKKPVDITMTIPAYFPLDRSYGYTVVRRNIRQDVLGKLPLSSGKIYKSFDGKRLLFEVGCKTVIYLLISPGNMNHHHFFIQGRNDFVFDCSDRIWVSEVAHNTRHVETVVRFEMYFLMGLVSTVSVPAWLAVTGVNAAFAVANNTVKVNAAKKLVNTLIAESETLKKSAPTFHRKLWEFFESEVDGNWNRYLKQLPTTIANDEQVQGQLAGILFGKATAAPKSLTAWGAIATVLTQAAVKSVTKSGDAYIKVVNQRYGPIIDALSSNNWRNPAQSQAAAQKLIAIYRESGVNISLQEGVKIINEIMSHTSQIEASLIRVVEAINDYNRAVGI